MSAAGKNYRSLIDDDGECSNSNSVMKWTISSKAIENTDSTIRELIDVRDGYKECIGFLSQELNVFMLDLCTGKSIFLLFFLLHYLYIINYYLYHFNTF